jgi:uncharacterized protein YecA (UPF0149 family)
MTLVLLSNAKYIRILQVHQIRYKNMTEPVKTNRKYKYYEILQVARNSDQANAEANKAVKVPPKVDGKKVGGNDPCPCGSGKKYKRCCGE